MKTLVHLGFVAGLMVGAVALPDTLLAQNANSLVQNQLQQLQRNQQSQQLQKQWLRQRQSNDLERKQRALNAKERTLRNKTGAQGVRGLSTSRNAQQRLLRSQQQQLRTRQQLLRRQIRQERLKTIR